MKPFNILVAQDDPDDRFLIREAFSKSDVPARLFFVDNGEQLLDCLQRGNGSPGPFAPHHPDLVLANLRMPRLNGLETAAVIKADSTLESIPVVLLSNLETVQHFAQGHGLDLISCSTDMADEALLHCIELAANAVRKFWFCVQKLVSKSICLISLILCGAIFW